MPTSLEQTKQYVNYLVRTIALVARGLNPITAFAGQNKIEIAEGSATTDAKVEYFEPMDDARSAAIPGTPPAGTPVKSVMDVPMHWIDNGITGLSHMDIHQAMKSGEIPTIISLVAASCVEKLNNAVLPGVLARTFNYHGAVNSIPADKAVIIGGRAAMQDRAQGCYAPDDMSRVLLLDGTIYQNLMGQSELTAFLNVGDQQALISGKLRPMHGFGRIRESSYLTGVNNTAGTLDDGKVANGTAAPKGSQTILVKSTAGGKTLKIGNVFVIAGSTQRYTVFGKPTYATAIPYPGRLSFADATIDQTGVEVAIYPPLAADAAEDAAITVLGTHGYGGLALHPTALVSVARKLPEPGPGYVASDWVTDPETNIAWRVQNFGGYLQNNWTVDFCSGCALAVPRYAARIIRTPWS